MSKLKEIIRPRTSLEANLLHLQQKSDFIGREIFKESLHALRSFDPLEPTQSKREVISDLTTEANTVLGLDQPNDGTDTKMGFEVRYFYDNELLDQKKGDQWTLQLPIWSLNFFSTVEGSPKLLRPVLVPDLNGEMGWRICLRFHATRVDGLQTRSPKTVSIAIPLESLLQHPVQYMEYEAVAILDNDDKIFQTHKRLKFPY